MEVVLDPYSDLLGQTVLDSDFRLMFINQKLHNFISNRFHASIIAFARRGEPVFGRIGSLTFTAGGHQLLFVCNHTIRRYIYCSCSYVI